MKEDFDLCGYCCAWVHKNRSKSPEYVAGSYPKMMRKVLTKGFGLTKKVADDLIDCMCRGNCERMHETHVEKRASAITYADELLNDVFYCSDRWSWDRVVRIQWLYQRLRDRVEVMDA